MKKKILHLAGWYPSSRNPVSGIFVKEHVKATAINNDVIVYFCEGVDRKSISFCNIKDNEENGLRTIRSSYKKSPIPYTSFVLQYLCLFKVFRTLRKENWEPDIIHAHVYTAGFQALILNFFNKIPLIVTEHSSVFSRGLIKGLELRKAKLAFKTADIVCPVSKSLQSSIESCGIRAEFMVVPNVVHKNFFSLKRKERQEEGSIKLLSAALLDENKGIIYLLKALSICKMEDYNIQLDIVGDGPLRKSLEDYVNSNGLHETVFFHGIIDKTEVTKFMQEADIFVLPSLAETFSVVTAEALASGLPVLVTRCGGPEEYVNDEVGITVEAGNIEALVSGLEKMISKYEQYSYEYISEYAMKKFSADVVGKAYTAIYDSIL